MHPTQLTPRSTEPSVSEPRSLEPQLPPALAESVEPTTELESKPGFLERFLDSFFQEKNIKWMLVVGAAIVFGSSLMLVTKAWPDWSPVLKYLTIVGYTAVIFTVSEVSRRRLKLSATYKVLQTLTLLLLPICFLSLDWLSAGTAVQTLTQCLLLIPAFMLLWQASTRISDHWLRGRQTTFLICFGLLCASGALPTITTPIAAFAFVLASWVVLTIGALKVNRHTFWLSESHRLPRVFGFLPVMILGLQFVVLVGTKAITAIPIQWIGFATVLVAATVLITARAVADVFRQRTGDLVRPLPWPIIAPLFTGLVLAALGVALSLVGFSYANATTYAAVPTALVAAVVFALAARDTRSQGLVWASLITLAIGYQCAPVMFVDLVNTVRSATADAINQERVPVSLYGLTYLPLLAGLTLLSGVFTRRNLKEFARPIQHFVTVVATCLLTFAATSLTSLFIVASVNVVAFLVYAVAFRDRRYVLGAITALVASVSVAIPALAQMDYSVGVGIEWITPSIAALALAMTIAHWPDKLVNRIQLHDGWRLDDLTSLMRTRDGQDRNEIQLVGCCLAAAAGIHWIGSASLSIAQPLGQASLCQFGFLIAAMVVFTIRNPRYVSAACIWGLMGFAAMRWVVGLRLEPTDVAMGASLFLIASSAIAYIATKAACWSSDHASISQIRKSLGLEIPTRFASVGQHSKAPNNVPNFLPNKSPKISLGGIQQRIIAFSVSLLDLSSVALMLLTAFFFVPTWTVQHLASISGDWLDPTGFQMATASILVWHIVVAWRSRLPALGMAAAAMLPIATTSLIMTSEIEVSFTLMCLAWGDRSGCCSDAVSLVA